MAHITTTVYLNHAEGHLLGFNLYSPARLHQAADFYREVDGAPVDLAVRGALEIVFEQLNIDHPQHAWAQHYRPAGHRNLCVGDVVVLAETAWACSPVGWTPVTAGELRAAIVATR
ncbi:hypothetical protein AN931_26565 [Mycobacterium intracellulare subsp. chimaera]|uniref:hypothetical protein n=1 Tax=Mycobacterium intracellulare TaxID=1767 RepID=UPI0006CA6398|nr:hypothetical protein [Mycobacterium intracellulare]KPN45934.1 hypothetical protein AN931_26565 [Mycobacterium intracellulare subsp. chimaera]KPN46938.1 hypothetical protein AN933_25370 [Mycobacterium intracellulare subsp. chimaera]MDM3909617.1 hypothetical protein [Mycobacterium intracellulare subsp. chimaera]